MSSKIWLSHGLRHVSPYYKKTQVFVKGRWVGRTVLDVLVKEFRSFDMEYYTKAIQKGRFKLIRKSDPVLKLDPLKSEIKSGDILETVIHRHEPPVKAWPIMHTSIKNNIEGIPIVFEDDQMLVVDKPCGIPVHPTGGYHLNSLTEVIKHGREDQIKLYPCHRLDKVTSGITIMAKNNLFANTIQTKIQSHEMQKLYLARVEGKFPNSAEPYDLTNWKENDEYVVKCSTSIFTVQTKKQFPNGLGASKRAETWFYPGWYDSVSNESIVICKPLTGRTHQIRIHLLKMGFPIINDTLYCPAVTKYPLYVDFFQQYDEWENSTKSKDHLNDQFNKLIEEATTVRESRLANIKDGSTCVECELPIMRNPEDISDLTLDLHAWKYYHLNVPPSSEDSSNTYSCFQTGIPVWASC